MDKPILLLILMLSAWQKPGPGDPVYIIVEPAPILEKLGYRKIDNSLFPTLRDSLKPFITSVVGDRHEIIQNWDQYTIQILQKTSRYRNQIVIKAYCSQHKPSDTFDPKTAFLPVAEGGSCYFSVYFDLNQMKYIAFVPNEVGTNYTMPEQQPLKAPNRLDIYGVHDQSTPPQQSTKDRLIE